TMNLEYERVLPARRETRRLHHPSFDVGIAGRFRGDALDRAELETTEHVVVDVRELSDRRGRAALREIDPCYVIGLERGCARPDADAGPRKRRQIQHLSARGQFRGASSGRGREINVRRTAFRDTEENSAAIVRPQRLARI